MAIKVTERVETTEQFPKLMLAPRGKIWLMSSPTKGTVVQYSADKSWIGYQSESVDSSRMQDYIEPLTLENV